MGRLPSNVVPLPEFGDVKHLTCLSTFDGSGRTSSVPFVGTLYFV